MKSVLKYPGSKWNIAQKIVSLVPEHHTYLEPFFGSGAVFFTKEPSRIEMINDMDCNVTNLFNCIKEDSERLARLIMSTPFSREEYDKTFEEIEIKDNYDKAVHFLTQCWQGHGFRTNGYKVGWKNDVVGRERMYALWNWYRLPDWVIDTAERLRQTQIENRPAVEVIKRFNNKNVFMYIDPPYLLSTRAGKQYKHEMIEDDHIELLESLLDSEAKIMISGYDSELYNEYLKDWNKTSFTSCAEHGKQREEVIWCNYPIEEQMKLF